MPRIKLHPYKAGSQSAKLLAQNLGIRRLKRENSAFVPRPTDLIINWGDQSYNVVGGNVFNTPEAVATASNKLRAFQELSLSDVLIPEFTTELGQAAQWIHDGKKVVCRTLLRGSSGRGIVIAENTDQLVEAPLYVKYVPKRHEYRVHVVGGEVIDYQRKMRNSEVPDDQVDWAVRNHDNGFVFGREGVSLPTNALTTAVDAVAALSLDFGAVDLIWNERSDSYYVLEVNTAPGLTGTTLEKYTEAFQNVIESNFSN